LNKSNTKNLNLGKDILLAGLVIQIITFAFFTIVAVHFDIVVAKSGQHGGKWRQLMKALYAACTLVLVTNHCCENSSENVDNSIKFHDFVCIGFDLLGS
jgi:hypothetical protein